MEQITIKKFFKKTSGLDRFLIAVVLIGTVVCLISFFRGILVDRQAQVEYLSGGNASGETAKTLFVDIEGAVLSPGVYELKDGSRIKDVLVAAGGLGTNADRDFCEKNINMAEEIKDGQKIYIPSSGITEGDRGYFEASIQSKKISINTATAVELDTLWGVGQARIDSIVKNRPYKSVEELVTKGVLTKAILEKNIELLTVY